LPPGPFVGKMGPVKRGGYGRKLLVASIGAAAVSYVACGGDDATPGSREAGAAGAGGGSVVDAGGAGSMTADAIVEHALPGFADVVANRMSR